MEKKMKQKEFKKLNNRGITLIALVITMEIRKIESKDKDVKKRK